MSEPGSAAPQGQGLIQWATLLAGVSLVLVVVNIALAMVDQSQQAQVNQRQQRIAQAAQLEALTSLLTRALSAQEESSKDPQLKDLLTRAGGGVAPVPTAPAAAPVAKP